mmetsp:Transcript_101976/g.227870  ORF Transcript_101976/g.227870 Transcript_101976/m.227870 type:complete len:164 (+) Transcript_101976:94-585(+)
MSASHMLSRSALDSKHRLDLLLTVHTVVAASAGLLALLLPHCFGFFFGEQWHDSWRYNPDDGQVKITHVIIRIYGALIVGQAFIVWHVKQSADGDVRRGIVRAYFIVFSLSGLVLLRSHLTDDHWNFYNWGNVFGFIGMAAFYGWFYAVNPPPVFEGLDKAMS